MPIKWNLQMFFKDTYNEEKGEFDKLGTGSEPNYGPKSEG
jgi:hypothetical protein